MIYSKTCEYALRALAFLTVKPREEWTRVPEVSEKKGVPGPYVSKIFQCLAHAGILRSCRGATGGFALKRSAETISIMEVIRAIDDGEQLRECAMGLDNCQDGNPCPLHKIWKKMREKIVAEFEQTSIASLRKKTGKLRYRELRRTRLNSLMKS